eukprot:TRINITY_DN16825_c0_g2_i1.p1 TRINITY_DN16825_c0_g2~~TRINITY_DN16825_c0_g2_i1.p1  ORF type:complete len:514 (+),score=72.95 TRINITY_DN16825_c0_g2_i1:185-1543(+)
MLGPVSEFSGLTAWGQYTQAFDWALKTMSGLSRGLFPPADSQVVLAVCTVVSGVVVYALILSTISSALQMSSSASRFREKVDSAQSFLLHQRLPQSFRSEVVSFYRHVFRTMGQRDEGEILNDLPLPLDLRLTHAIGTRVVGRVPIFAEAVEKDKVLLVSLAIRLQPVVQPPGALLTVKGDYGDSMYFITAGECVIMGGDGVTVVHTLQPGDFVGEIALIHNVKRTATVLCKDFCNLLTLDRADFDEVTSVFPAALESIQKAASGRIMQILDQEKQERRERRNKRALAQEQAGSPRPIITPKSSTDDVVGQPNDLQSRAARQGKQPEQLRPLQTVITTPEEEAQAGELDGSPGQQAEMERWLEENRAKRTPLKSNKSESSDKSPFSQDRSSEDSKRRSGRRPRGMTRGRRSNERTPADSPPSGLDDGVSPTSGPTLRASDCSVGVLQAATPT